MGGLYSGRKRRHTGIDDCLEIDLAQLHKLKILPGQRQGQAGRVCTLEFRKWREKDFVERTEQTYQVQLTRIDQDDGSPALVVTYRAVLPASAYKAATHEDHQHILRLTTTPAGFGGCRYWLECPDCVRRVRVVYIHPREARLTDVRPRCRQCLDLRYACQRSSYQERHTTYERFLLANYGLHWAAHRYNHELQAHYLEMTPELEAKRRRSVMDKQLKMLRLCIQFDLMIYRADLRNLRRLRSDEDRRAYWESVNRRETERESSRWIRLMFENLLLERLADDINPQAGGIFDERALDLYADVAAWLDPPAVTPAPAALPEPEPEPAAPADRRPIEEMEQTIISLKNALKRVRRLERRAAA